MHVKGRLSAPGATTNAAAATSLETSPLRTRGRRRSSLRRVEDGGRALVDQEDAIPPGLDLRKVHRERTRRPGRSVPLSGKLPLCGGVADVAFGATAAANATAPRTVRSWRIGSNLSLTELLRLTTRSYATVSPAGAASAS